MASKIQWKNLDEIRVEMAKKWETIAKQNMAQSKKSKIKMASSSCPISKMQQKSFKWSWAWTILDIYYTRKRSLTILRI